MFMTTQRSVHFLLLRIHFFLQAGRTGASGETLDEASFFINIHVHTYTHTYMYDCMCVCVYVCVAYSHSLLCLLQISLQAGKTGASGEALEEASFFLSSTYIYIYTHIYINIYIFVCVTTQRSVHCSLVRMNFPLQAGKTGARGEASKRPRRSIRFHISIPTHTYIHV